MSMLGTLCEGTAAMIIRSNLSVVRTLFVITLIACPMVVAAQTPAPTQEGDSESIKSSSGTQKIFDKGSAANFVLSYLNSAAGLDSNSTKAFLSLKNRIDIIIEFKANSQSGWKYNRAQTEIKTETIDKQHGKANVSVQVVYSGGSTFMGVLHKFHLIVENGGWKISDIAPAPKSAGPGVSPL